MHSSNLTSGYSNIGMQAANQNSNLASKVKQPRLLQKYSKLPNI